MQTKAVIARIEGRVQGVGFRFWTQGEARALGLSGWVRNEPDRTVTAMLAGAAGSVDEMVGRLRIGPPGSRVDKLELHETDPSAAPDGFEIRR